MPHCAHADLLPDWAVPRDRQAPATFPCIFKHYAIEGAYSVHYNVQFVYKPSIGNYRKLLAKEQLKGKTKEKYESVCQ